MRCIEDKQVAVKAIEVWEGVVKVITHWCALPANKRPKENKSFDMLVEHHKDFFMLAKLRFFTPISAGAVRTPIHVRGAKNPYPSNFCFKHPMKLKLGMDDYHNN